MGNATDHSWLIPYLHPSCRPGKQMGDVWPPFTLSPKSGPQLEATLPTTSSRLLFIRQGNWTPLLPPSPRSRWTDRPWARTHRLPRHIHPNAYPFCLWIYLQALPSSSQMGLDNLLSPWLSQELVQPQEKQISGLYRNPGKMSH